MAPTPSPGCASSPGPRGDRHRGCGTLGFTQWAVLLDPPPELAAAVVAAGPHKYNASVWVRLLRRQRLCRLDDLVQPGGAQRLGGAASAAGPAQAGRGGRCGAHGCRSTGAAGRGRALVRILGRASRQARSVLGFPAGRRGAGPGGGAGAAHRRLAEHLPAATIAAPVHHVRGRASTSRSPSARGRTASCWQEGLATSTRIRSTG